MSQISLVRFVSSVYNEKIKINSEFDIDDILNVNYELDSKDVLPANTLPETSYEKDVVKKPTLKDKFDWEIKRYVNGNVQLISSFPDSEVKNNETKIKRLKQYALRNLLIDKLLSTTHRREIGKAKRTIFLFPTYDTDSKGKDRLLDEISSNYKWIFDLPNFLTEPVRFFLDDVAKDIPDKTKGIDTNFKISFDQFKYVIKQPYNHTLLPNNAIIFLPVINPSESPETFESRITGIMQQILQSIETESKVMEGQLVQTEKIPFFNISYAVYDDKDNEMFTDYYKDSLGSKKKKILKKILDDTFKRGATIGKQVLQISNTKQIPFQLTTIDQTEKDFKNFSSSVYKSFVNDDDYLTLKDELIKLINKFKEFSKRSENLQYSISAASDSNSNFLRVFYRINNMDIPVDVDLIRTGTNYLYKLKGVRLDTIDKYSQLVSSSKKFKDGLYVGFLFKSKLSSTKQIFRFQVHIAKTLRERSLAKLVQTVDEDEEMEKKDIDSKSVMLELMKNNLTGEVTFQKSGSRDNLKGLGLNFKGKITEYENLHIYEKYRWFSFRHIDGSLSDETNIRFFPDVLFDRKTFIEFLKSKNSYDEKKTRIPYEFLKINKDVEQLVQYSDFIQEKYKSSNTYNPSLLGRFTESKGEELVFENKIKSGILEIIFTPINVIYVGKSPSTSVGDKDTSKNYKIVSFQEYKPSGFRTMIDSTNIKYQTGDFYKRTLEQVINGEDEEYKYCDKHLLDKCEIMKEFFSREYLVYLANKRDFEYKKAQLEVLKNTDETELEEYIKENEENGEKKSVTNKASSDTMNKLKKDKEIEDKKNGLVEIQKKIDSEPKKFIEEEKKSEEKDTKKFINNPSQHISLAIVTVTQEDINFENFNSFLNKNKCKTLSKQIRYDLKGIKRNAFEKLQSGILMVSSGGNKIIKNNRTYKYKNKINKKIINKKYGGLVKKVKKNKKIKPFKFTRKIY